MTCLQKCLVLEQARLESLQVTLNETITAIQTLLMKLDGNDAVTENGFQDDDLSLPERLRFAQNYHSDLLARFENVQRDFSDKVAKIRSIIQEEWNGNMEESGLSVEECQMLQGWESFGMDSFSKDLPNRLQLVLDRLEEQLRGRQDEITQKIMELCVKRQQYGAECPAHWRPYLRETGQECDWGRKILLLLDQELQAARQEVRQRRDRVEHFKRKISMLASMISEMNPGSPDSWPSPDRLDDAALEEWNRIFTSLTDQWRLVRKEKIQSMMKELLARFQKYYVSKGEQNLILNRIGDVDDEDAMVRILEEISLLDGKYADAIQILNLIHERQSLIQRMIAFEKSASDPKRLFQSSFQLNEEEKFRKTSFPTLLKIEHTLQSKVLQWEKDKEESFLFEDQRYLDRLEDELRDRFVNETVFEFFHRDTMKPRGGRVSLSTATKSGTPGTSRRSFIVTADSSRSLPSSGKENIKFRNS